MPLRMAANSARIRTPGLPSLWTPVAGGAQRRSARTCTTATSGSERSDTFGAPDGRTGNNGASSTALPDGAYRAAASIAQASAAGTAAAAAAAVPPGGVAVPAGAWSVAAGGTERWAGRARRRSSGGGGSSGAGGGGTSPWAAWRAWLGRMGQLLQYRLMLLFRLPAWGKLLAMLLVGLPIVGLGAALLTACVPDMGWHDAARHAFYVLQNVPGTDITRFEQSGRLVLLAIHLLSLYTFATLVGLLTEDVRATVEEIRSGNFPIPAQGHTVVLDPGGDPQRLLALVQQVLTTREARGDAALPRGSLVVLSTQPKDELDALIADALPKRAGLIVTRHGSPVKVADLERVAAGAANTVLLLSPSRPMGHITQHMQQQLTLAALRALHVRGAGSGVDGSIPWQASREGTALDGDDGGGGGGGGATLWRILGEFGGAEAGRPAAEGRRRQRVVVELCCCGGGGGGGGAGGGASMLMGAEAEERADDPLQVSYVSSASSACRVAVQCAVQPGLAAVFDSVFARPEEPSLHIVPLPQHLVGSTFGDARRRFRRATLCGLLPRHHRHPPQHPPLAADAASFGGNEQSEADASQGHTPDPGSDADRGNVSRAASDASISGSGGGGSGGVLFCPPDARCLRPGDHLVLLAARRADCTASEVPVEPPPPPPLLPPYDARRTLPRRLVLLSADGALAGAMLAALEEFAAPGCEVVVLSREPCAGLPPGPTPRSGLVLRNHVGDPLSHGSLLRAGVLEADAVIMAGLEALPPDEADAAVQATALLLQQLLADPEAAEAAAEAEAESAGVAAAASAATAGNGGGGRRKGSALPRRSSMPQRLWSEDSDAGDLDVEYHWGGHSLSSSSGSSVDFAEWQGAAIAMQQRRRGRQAEQRRRQAPTKPLTFVCSLHDPQNRAVLHSVAAAACRTAAATVAAAVSRYGGAAGGPVGGAGGEPPGATGSGDAGGGGALGPGFGASGAAAATAAAAVGVAARGLSIEVVQPSSLVSGILAQVAADPRLASGLEDLLDDSGCELYLKRPDRYGLPPLTRLTWDQVCEVVHGAGDAALGYLHRGQLVLAPPADSPLVLVAGDKLVVLSESFL